MRDKAVLFLKLFFEHRDSIKNINIIEHEENEFPWYQSFDIRMGTWKLIFIMF